MNSMITNNLKKSVVRKMLLPVMLLLLCAVLYAPAGRIPIKELLFPASIGQDEDLKALFEAGTEYVNAKVDTLYYSGCDYTRNGKTAGHFYYSLTNNFCRFYLIKTGSRELPSESISGAVLKGRIVDAGPLYEPLVDMVAKQLEWTADGLAELSDAYMVSTVDYWNWQQLAFLAAYLLCLAIGAVDFLILLFYLVFPLWTPSLRRLRKYGNQGALLSKAELEMKHLCQADAGGMYVTPGYFVNVDMLQTLVVPLEKTVWIYTLAQMHRFLGAGGKLSCTIHIVMEDGHIYECSKKRREDADAVLNAAAAGHGEILIGYSEENKRLARERNNALHALRAANHNKKGASD